MHIYINFIYYHTHATPTAAQIQWLYTIIYANVTLTPLMLDNQHTPPSRSKSLRLTSHNALQKSNSMHASQNHCISVTCSWCREEPTAPTAQGKAGRIPAACLSGEIPVCCDFPGLSYWRRFRAEEFACRCSGMQEGHYEHAGRQFVFGLLGTGPRHGTAWLWIAGVLDGQLWQ